MPRGPGQMMKIHLKTNGFTCLCCAPMKTIVIPGDDGT